MNFFCPRHGVFEAPTTFYRHNPTRVQNQSSIQNIGSPSDAFIELFSPQIGPRDDFIVPSDDIRGPEHPDNPSDAEPEPTTAEVLYKIKVYAISFVVEAWPDRSSFH